MRGAPALVIAVLLAAFSLAYGCAAPRKAALPMPEAPARSLKSAAIITLKNNGAEISGRASVIAKSPAFLRIEVFGPLGGVAALIIYNGEHLYVYSDGTTASYNGLDVDAALPLHPEILVSALTGDIGRLKDFAKTSAGASYSVEASGENGLNISKYVDEAKTASAHLDNFRDVDGAIVPFSIAISDWKTGRVITIEHSSVEINTDVTEGAFVAPETNAP